MKPRLLDLFCGAGGCSVGYARAGFEVVGVDIVPQPNYPFDFVEWDALEFVAHPIVQMFDAIHASPPCQAYSPLTARWARQHLHPDLVAPVRTLLQATGLPYVIENVEGAPLENPARLCGSFFGLDVRRHRLFETNWPLMSTPCSHHWQKPRFRSLDLRQKGLASVVGVHGHLNYPGEKALREQAMGIDWMTSAELVEAIPPAYTELIGGQLLNDLLGDGGVNKALVLSVAVTWAAFAFYGFGVGIDGALSERGVSVAGSPRSESTYQGLTLREWARRAVSNRKVINKQTRTIRRLQHAQLTASAHFFGWLAAADCVHRHESIRWDARTGNGYYGGLQADISFQRTYAPDHYARWGTANNWPWWAQFQMSYRAWLFRGWQPWPNTSRACGLR